MEQINGIEFLSPPSDCHMDDDYFNDYYNIASSDHFWHMWRLKVVQTMLPKDYKWDMTLDVGCGNGVFIEQIKNNYRCKIAGCDLNITALQRAIHLGTDLYLYNIHQKHMEFKEKFSTILLFDILEHIKDPIDFLKSVKFHLKDDGILMINVPALQFLYSRYDEIQGHTKRYYFGQLEKELESAGFTITRASYWGMAMIPVALIRKIMLFFNRKGNTIEKGFQPGSKFADLFLRAIMKVECALFPMPPLGTSLLVIAKKTMNCRI